MCAVLINFMSKSASAFLSTDNSENSRLSDLRSKLNTAAEKAKLQTIQELEGCGETGLVVLMEFLLRQQSSPASFVEGKAYETLLKTNDLEIRAFLQQHFPYGVLPLNSASNVDYEPLQKLLAQQQFQAADQLTLQKMCELAGPTAVQRNWLYFSEIESFSVTDLQTIDQLWQVHSEGKFGFSVQRQIWLGLGKNWDDFWPKIGWKKDNQWTRYPQEFTWDLTAPRGHLPLSNQLRGVRVINALLSHPAWAIASIP